mmetsp:Transcript_27444/g.30793  ORF Transcript_27444/g.30793 Transcript_27444/m.30793 type:complete len:513 (-) Transcript_27444:925-2463(-)
MEISTAIEMEISNDYNPSVLILITTTAAFFIFSGATYFRWMHNNDDSESNSDHVPWAPGAVPILGHALLYRKDPSGFLVNTRKQCGPVFRLNLAGKIMILVCGPEEQRQLAKLPESLLSSQQAVADIGFEQTLGSKNVYRGTNLHKGIVKGVLYADADRQLILWLSAMKEAIQIETKLDNEIDFFHVIRRVMLRAAVEVFIGKCFLRDWKNYDFLKEFMDLQDSIEDVTAKAVVLPKYLALVALLWPLQRRREALQLVIKQRLEKVLQRNQTAQNDVDVGFWLREVRSRKIEISDIAEYIVGLLFAGHKNSAIGASQSYLLMQEYASDKVRVKCYNESEILISTESPTWSQFKSLCPTLRRICLESLRLTAHSIGGVRICKSPLTVSVKLNNGNNKKEMLYKIPKGSTVGFAHIASSLDTSIWGNDATVFDSNLHRPAELYADDYKFTTFSHGIHKCPGQELAMIHLQALVAILLTKYDVSLPENIPNLCFERATLAQRNGLVRVKIRRKQK